MTIAIIDYGMGNLTSVRNALKHLGADVVVSHDPGVLRAAKGVVLPGVGALAKAWRICTNWVSLRSSRTRSQASTVRF
jgi:glutamine amidotransferase